MSAPSTAILVLGSGGLLGRHVVDEYERLGQSVTALTHRDLDVTDEQATVRLLDHLKPVVVINCAALCHFQRCEESPKLSAEVNRDAPIRLAGLAAERGIRLVHFSTDYIFGGDSQVPYREEDAPHPLSVYGVHKAAVEAAFAFYDQHLLLRVAWIFGNEGKTFLSLLPNLLMQRATLEVAAGKRGSCLHAGYAARIIRELLERKSTGLYNLVHAGETSWEGFAGECLRQLKERGYEPACRNLIKVPYERMATPSGARPLYSVLDASRLAAELDHPLTDWKEGLSQFLDVIYPINRPVLA